MQNTEMIKVIREGLGDYPMTPLIAEVIKFTFANKYESMAIVNERGEIEFLDPWSERLLNIPHGKARGRKMEEFIPKSELYDVVLSKQAHTGRILHIEGKDRVVSRFPIIRGKKTLGAFGKALIHSLESVDRLQEEARILREKVRDSERLIYSEYTARYSFHDILGTGRLINDARDLARKIAKADIDVLIQGESGTGKELFAHAIHSESKKRYKPFVKVNCPAIPIEIAESELFGYEKGAFTGAGPAGKAGKFELAQDGTVFLDEIGALPISIQAKLLRVIQEREIERLGGRKIIQLKLRLIAATNAPLNMLSEKGMFRSDLYFRLSRAILHVPSLRERKEDIPIYSDHFLKTFNRVVGTNVRKIALEAMDALMDYAWPGNVRELANVVEQSLFQVGKSKELRYEHLPIYIQNQTKSFIHPIIRMAGSLQEKKAEVEKVAIVEALARSGGNKRRAAQEMGIQRSALYLKMKKYGIAP